jgi:myosin-5
MKAVASKVSEKNDTLLLPAVDLEDSGLYEIAEPRVITALETYTPSCKSNYVLIGPAPVAWGALSTSP